MKKIIAGVVLVLAMGGGLLFAQDYTASISKVSGKVEIQQGDAWVPAKIGQVITPGTTVSTGFRSELELKIGPSLLTVKALSRLTVNDLVLKDGKATTDLSLRVGKVSAKVEPIANTTQSFKVKSPISTASVRGTAFDFDGETLQVTRGLVQFEDARGGSINVPVGEAAKAPDPESTKDMSGNQDLVSQESSTNASAGSDFSDASLDSDYFDWSFSGWSEEDLLSFFLSYDWSAELPNTYVYIYGIQP